jgi:hypothetical protein
MTQSNRINSSTERVGLVEDRPQCSGLDDLASMYRHRDADTAVGMPQPDVAAALAHALPSPALQGGHQFGCCDSR